MRKIITVVVLTTILFSYSSCKNEGAKADLSQMPIATVKDKTLYKSEVTDVIPRGTSAEDSTIIAETYVQSWIKEQLMYDKAAQNIVNKDEIDELVEDYRKSLINLYQERLLKEYFSKKITDEELQSFYEKNKTQLKLKENIIKGLYLKVPINSKELSTFQKWYKQSSDVAKENIEKNTLQNAVNYEYFYDKWVNFNDVAENMPLLITSGSQFLQTNRSVEVRDSAFVYLLNIKEYKLEGNEAPFEYIKNQLTEIYIEQQRTSYLNKVQEDLYNRAISDNEIKFYDK